MTDSKSYTKESIEAFASQVGIGKVLAELLLKRGITDASEANAFLYPSPKDFEDPLLLSGMKDAVERIRLAVSANEKIVIYGDYDCDGITATAILYDYLSSLGADVSYFIPSRFDTGYGLTMESVEEIAETYFPDLIITVDCGIASAEEAEFLRDVLAIDLIVTDHHTLPQVLPQAIVVDPKLDPDTRSADLCGAGVAFKVVQALGGVEAAWKYVELAAVGTIADIVPLVKENRLIASLGLKKINSREKINKGLRLLIESIPMKGEVTASTVGYHIAPRINALGRMGDCSEVVTLFLTEEYVVLDGLIEKLSRANELRKSLVNQVYREAVDLLKEYDLATHKIIFLYKADWNPGVLGLVAGKLKGDFSRPTILMTGEDELRGSARSPEGVDIYATIKSAEPYLVKFGGHKRAAGLSLTRENLVAARNAMDTFLEENYPREAFSRQKTYDLALSSDAVGVRLAEELALLEPTGEGNPKPTFLFSTEQYPLIPFGSGQHAKSKINDQSEIIAFGIPLIPEAIAAGEGYDMICECSKEVFKNVEKAQMRVVEFFSRGMGEAGEDIALFNRYLRAHLYKEEACEFTAVNADQLEDLFYDDTFCTLFLSFERECATNLSRSDLGERIHGVEYGRPYDLPWNEILVAPDVAPVGYKSIVLLDTPLSTGYVAYLAKTTGAAVYVVKDHYPFTDKLVDADLSAGAIRATYDSIMRFLFSGSGASSPLDLTERLQPQDRYAFLLHFYILYESGSISVGQGFALSARAFVDPSMSMIYRRVVALRKRL